MFTRHYFIVFTAITTLIISQWSTAQIVIHRLKSNIDPRICEIKIQYPVCSDTSAHILNDSIRVWVTAQKKQFLVDAKPQYSKLNPDSVYVSELPYMKVEVLSTYRSGSFISYCLQVNICPDGGCHGTNVYFTFNYDLRRRKFLLPNDIITTPDDKICRLVRNYIGSDKNGSYDVWQTAHHHACTANDFMVNIEKNNVVFNFSAYELGAGWYRVFIPRSHFILNLNK